MIQIHELAGFYPMHSKALFLELVEGMRRHGYRSEFPIVIYEGKILDGRNRYKAAIEAGVEPVIVEFSGDDPLEFVVHANSNRRDLGIGQRAAIGIKIQKYWNEKGLENKCLGGQAAGRGREKDLTNLSKPINARAEAAKAAGVSEGTMAIVSRLEREEPELFEQVASGKLTPHKAQKKVKERKKKEKRAEVAALGAAVEPSDRWHVWKADINTWQPPRKYDFIITDPPYPKEYLPLYEILAKRAKEWLRPGGLLVAMCPHYHLSTIFELMSKHIDYYWISAYMVPGGQSSVPNRRAVPQWKPLLMFSNGDYTGKTFTDVFESDRNEKEHHEWGQSESGMYDIVSRISFPGQYILDPFCGGGTTGIAALKTGCLFDGIDIKDESVNIAKARLNEY